MLRRRRTAALVAAFAGIGLLVAGAVVAGTRSSDATALQKTRHNPSQGIESKVDDLLGRMTLTEKLQQVQLLSDGQITDADAKAGVGWVFSLTDPAKIDHFQHVAVEQSRLHIPILFAYDTIHGYRTIFPIPLGAASSFDPSVATADDTIAARETATAGIKQIYSPMVDVSHEPRWGRISEAAGEDPYLGSVFAAARVKAAQGSDYSAPDKVVTSVKHFAAYGQPEGGREYNTTDMSESRLRNLYLPPFKAAIDAGADTVMCSFNAINGVPGCADPELETDILKGEWHFDGFIRPTDRRRRIARVSAQDAGHRSMRPRRRGRRAGAAALRSTPASTPRWPSTNDPRLRPGPPGRAPDLDGAGRRRRATDFARQVPRGSLRPPLRDQAKAAAPDSFVTADGRGARGQRPQIDRAAQERGRDAALNPAKTVLVIGPLGDDSTTCSVPGGDGRDDDAVSVFAGIKTQDPARRSSRAARSSDTEPPNNSRQVSAAPTPALPRR